MAIPQALLDEWAQRKAKLAAWVERNLEAAGDARTVVAVDPKDDARMATITPSARVAGRWQLTWWHRGEPSGHLEFDTRDLAIRSLSGDRVPNDLPFGHCGEWEIVKNFHCNAGTAG